MHYILLALLVAITPYPAHAQGSLQGLITGLGKFLNDLVIPVILGIAFLCLVWNMVRFFIIGSGNPESQENARTLAFYSVAAFVFILAFWGIVRIVGNGIGLNVKPCTRDMVPDYMAERTSPCTTTTVTPPTVGVTPTAPATPAAGGGVPILPGGSDAPTSFTPEGLPVINSNPDGLPATSTIPTKTEQLTGAITMSANAFRTFASLWLATMSDEYGANADIISETLFADLATAENTNISYEERAEAMYRLVQLGVVPKSYLEDYITTVNTKINSVGEPEDKLTYTSVGTGAKEPVPLPAEVQGNISENQAEVQVALETWDYRNTPEVLNAELFDQSLPPDTRYSNFLQYYTEGPLYDEFTQNIMTEKLFEGDYSPLP